LKILNQKEMDQLLSVQFYQQKVQVKNLDEDKTKKLPTIT